MAQYIILNGVCINKNMIMFAIDSSPFYVMLEYNNGFNENGELYEVTDTNYIDLLANTGYVEVNTTGDNTIINPFRVKQVQSGTITFDNLMTVESTDSEGAISAAIVAATTITGGGGGGNERVIVSSSSNLTAGAVALTDYVYLLTGCQLTLPTAVGNKNRYTVVKIGSSLSSVLFTASQNANGSTQVDLIKEGEVKEFISNNSNWTIA